MNQKDRFNEILSQCMDRLFKGESIEQVLADYPEQAKELEPLLRTTAAARVFAKAQPRQDFKSRARYEFMMAARELENKPKRHGFFDFLRQPAWAISLTAVVVIVLAGGGTVAASSSSMPGEALYNVKLASEKVQLAVTPSDVTRAEMNAKFANRRSSEIEFLAAGGETEKIQMATARLNSNLVNISEIAQVEQPVQTNQSDARNSKLFSSATAPAAGNARAGAAPPAVGGAGGGASGSAGAANPAAPQATFGALMSPKAAAAPQAGQAAPEDNQVKSPMMAPAPAAASPAENAQAARGNFSSDSSNNQELTGNQKDNFKVSSDSNHKLTKNEKLRKIIDENYQVRKARLEKALEKAAPSARPAIRQALADSESEYNRSLKNLEDGTFNFNDKNNNTNKNNK